MAFLLISNRIFQLLCLSFLHAVSQEAMKCLEMKFYYSLPITTLDDSTKSQTENALENAFDAEVPSGSSYEMQVYAGGDNLANVTVKFDLMPSELQGLVRQCNCLRPLTIHSQGTH